MSSWSCSLKMLSDKVATTWTKLWMSKDAGAGASWAMYCFQRGTHQQSDFTPLSKGFVHHYLYMKKDRRSSTGRYLTIKTCKGEKVYLAGRGAPAAALGLAVGSLGSPEGGRLGGEAAVLVS